MSERSGGGLPPGYYYPRRRRDGKVPPDGKRETCILAPGKRPIFGYGASRRLADRAAVDAAWEDYRELVRGWGNSQNSS